MSKKRWVLQKADEKEVEVLQNSLNIAPVFCRLLVQRNIRTYEEARTFFRPSLSALPDPFLMKDMDKAVRRLSEAIQNQEKILLYGDYDVDGTTAVALMFAFLQNFGCRLDYYIPDRYKEGYGISLEGIEYAQNQDVSLIIAMDCGIRARLPAERAGDAGIDLIICDHHLPGETLPGALAILDPKRPDCLYPYRELSGCGVAFKLAQAYIEKHALNREILEDLLDFLAVSIAGDIVPVTGENRILAHFGLQKLNRTGRPGLRALIEKSRRRHPLRINDVVFGMAPMINAAGRLADADQAVRLMLATDRRIAHDYARVLDYRNKLRKEFDLRIAGEARDLFTEMPDWEHRRSIVLYRPHWHKGVIGIVASRMVEQFHRPAVLLTRAGEMVVGSARSIRGFDIHEALKLCEDLLISFGGHRHAAGLSLRPENVPSFQDRFEAVVFTMHKGRSFIPEIEVADELRLKDISPKFWRILRQFAPFGPGNRNPVFISRGVRNNSYPRLLKDKHLLLSVVQDGSPPFQAVGFDQAGHFNEIIKGNPFDICYAVEENLWEGKRSLRLMVKDIRTLEVGDRM